MVNWINSWQKGNKKAKYELVFRLGRITVFEINVCACAVYMPLIQCDTESVRMSILSMPMFCSQQFS